MRYAALIALIFSIQLCYAQDLSGHWEGELPPVTKELAYKVTMEIKHTGDSLTGSARYQAGNYWVLQKFRGIIKGADVLLEEYSVNGCNCVNGVKFCLKKMTGVLTTDQGKAELTIAGSWTSEIYYDGQKYIKGNCAPGKFFISKKLPPTPVTIMPSKAPLVAASAPILTSGPFSKSFNLVKSVPRFVPVYFTKKKDDRPLDGYYIKQHIDSAKVTSYAPLREADVMFQKRIWLEIDLREKFNNYMAAPRSRLIDALMEAVMQGRLVAHDPTPGPDDPGGDAFSTPLRPEQAMARLSDSSVVTKRDADNNIIDSKLQANPFDPDSIIRYRIKEDWIFDKQRSVFEPRIIGIAPLVKPKRNAPGLDYAPAFWIYFPEARKILAKKPIANANNDATGLTYDDAFIKRLFAGYIVKQSSTTDERIKDYTQGIDRLYEAQRIKKQLMDWELDLWQY